MIAWQRLVYYLGLAVVEATPPALLVTLVGGDLWGVLIAAVLAGALADGIMRRRLPLERQGPALALIGLLCALAIVKGLAAPGASPLGGWGAAIGLLVAVRDARVGVAYLGLVAGLYCFWRGSRLTLHDSLSLHRLFRAATVVLMLMIGFGFLGREREMAVARLASTQVLSFFAVGLIAIALASASEERDTARPHIGWRGMLMLLGAVSVVLVLGLLLGSLFGQEAGLVVRLLWQGLVLIIALILVPLVYVMSLVIEQLVRLLHLDRLLSDTAWYMPRPHLDQLPSASNALGGIPPWLQVVLRVAFALLPILLLVGLLLLSRRRARRRGSDDEERESLWSWSGLAADLRGLLTKLNAPRPVAGLRDTLARLRGGDPVSRIRRSYIRLLLIGEGRQQPRAAAQTPGEYAPAASAMLPDARQPIAALTGAYERARYHPESATPADADTAEQAWGAIDQADRRAS